MARALLDTAQALSERLGNSTDHVG
jgi:hypothetical protein